MSSIEIGNAQRFVGVERKAVRSRFYIGCGLLMIALSFAGFAPSIIDPTTRKVPLPLTPVVMTHAVVASAWLFLFVLQAWLAATKRVAIHRGLGIVGAALAVSFVVSGWMAVVHEARRGFDLSGDLSPPGVPVGTVDILAPLIGLAVFAILVTAAVLFRRRPEIHKRLMVLATIGALSPAPLTHLLNHWLAFRPLSLPIFLVSFAALLALQPIHDRISRRRMHPVSLWGGIGVFVVFQIHFTFVVSSALWLSFAEWLVPPT